MLLCRHMWHKTITDSWCSICVTHVLWYKYVSHSLLVFFSPNKHPRSCVIFFQFFVASIAVFFLFCGNSDYVDVIFFLPWDSFLFVLLFFWMGITGVFKRCGLWNLNSRISKIFSLILSNICWEISQSN